MVVQSGVDVSSPSFSSDTKLVLFQNHLDFYIPFLFFFFLKSIFFF